jgi:hypothetical protein
MINIQRPGHYLSYDALDKPFREQAYESYVAERRQIPTEELQRTVDNYDRKSSVGKFVFRMLSDEYSMLRIRAARQVLEERLVA